MATVQIIAQPTSVKMITGETFVAYAIYARIPENPSDEDFVILNSLDITSSLFVIMPSLLTHGNDGFEFTRWIPHSDVKVFRVEREDIIISSPLSRNITPEFDKYIARENVSLQDEITKLFKQLGLEFEEKSKDGVNELILDRGIQYLADLNNIEK